MDSYLKQVDGEKHKVSMGKLTAVENFEKLTFSALALFKIFAKCVIMVILGSSMSVFTCLLILNRPSLMLESS